MSKPLRAAVVGVGYLGRFHAQKYATLAAAGGVELVGVVDARRETAQRVADELGTRAFGDHRELLGAAPAVDLVSVASTTETHHAVARDFLAAGVHVLAEKPITVTVEQADELIALADARKLVLQVGHLERFNPAWLAVRDRIRKPVFIEAHRMAPFKARGIDVSVVLDLMIHDLDVVLALDGSEPVQVEAVGVPVLTPKVDIANARLRFASGLIANLTASRVSMDKVRKFRVFAPATYVSVDFAAREAQVYRLEGGAAGPTIAVQRTSSPDEEPLRRQLAAFVESVRKGEPPRVSGRDGRRALALALTILERIQTGLAGGAP